MDTPSSYHPDLEGARLSAVVSTLVTRRDQVVQRLPTFLKRQVPFLSIKQVPENEQEADLDVWWSVACAAYQITRASLKALEEEHKWLTVQYDGLAFVILIGKVPMRLGYYERLLKPQLAAEVLARKEMHQTWLPSVTGELQHAVMRLELEAERFAPVSRVRLRLVDEVTHRPIRTWDLYSAQAKTDVLTAPPLQEPATREPARATRKSRRNAGRETG
ncbi:MAG TPA: hypothetical protein VG937_29750 [Polyangiaceae bacterium]|nr:hypothetical protein [Polyangiaceae bacterium]